MLLSRLRLGHVKPLVVNVFVVGHIVRTEELKKYRPAWVKFFIFLLLYVFVFVVIIISTSRVCRPG